MSAPTRILFVDDEPNILSGLRRMLRPMRKEWEMEFAESGQDALERMKASPCQIVVSDMRMPGMDGAELLYKIKAEYPDTIRIILSGHSEMESILRAIGPSHQFLAKPCDQETLQKTIRRATSLRKLLSDEKLEALVSQTTTLPSLPKLFQDVVEELQKPNCSMKMIGELISRDVGMSAQILKIVNSAYFGLMGKITTMDRAVTFLGLETINALILAADVFSTFEGSDTEASFLESLWSHSLETAGFARLLAKNAGFERHEIDNTFMAALLHDLGKLILLGNIPQEYDRVLLEQNGSTLAISELERKHLGAGHGEIGAYMIGLWGLPDNILEAVAFHATPSEAPSEDLQPLTVVHAADVFSRTLRQGGGSSHADENYLEKVGVLNRWDEWRELCAGLIADGEAA